MVYVVSRKEDLSYEDPDISIITPIRAKRLLHEEKELEFDVETTGLLTWKSELLTYQFGKVSGELFVVDAETVPITEFKDTLEAKELTLYAHNAKFELNWLYKHNIFPKGRIRDTMLQERILYMGDISHKADLKSCVSRYIGYEEAEAMDKDSRAFFDERSIYEDDFILYSAGDVKYLREISRAQDKEIELKDCRQAVEIDNSFVKVLAYVEHCGMHMDEYAWYKKMARDHLEMVEHEDQLNQYLLDNNKEEFLQYEMTAGSFKPKVILNWNSPAQVLKFFHAEGIHPQTVDKKTGVVKDTINANVLKKYDHPLIPIYIRYKECAKKWGAYGHNFLLLLAESPDGRIRTKYTQIINTGRMSSGSKKLKLYNAQNLPKPITKWDKINKIELIVGNWERTCFTPEEDNVFIVSDFSQQEQVIMANKSQDPGLLEFFRAGGGDMHSFVARSMYPQLKDLDFPTIKEQFKGLRDNAKSVGFTINYGGSEKTLADNLGIPMSEASDIFKKYFSAFPGVSNYLETQRQKAWDEGEILIDNITGRRAYFPEWKDRRAEWDNIDWTIYKQEKALETPFFKDTLAPLVSKLAKYRAVIQKSSLNYPIQGTAAEMTKLAGILIFKWITKNKLLNVVKICNIIHDEYLIECPKDISETTRETVEKSMNTAGKVFCKTIPCKAEAGITNLWHH